MCRAAFEQAQLVIGKPTGVAHDATHQMVVPRNPEAAPIGWIGDCPENLVAQRGWDALIGINEEDPVALG